MGEESNREDWDDLGSPPTDTFNWGLAKLWLRTCEQEHGDDCARQIQSPEVIDTLLVDTRSLCLTKANSASRYVALSYVWGQVQQFQTTTANLPDLLQPNGLPEMKLPNVIRDAITVVRSMGERYLWVDALCIPQDDFAVKHFQIAHMATIYTSAVLTLVAASSKAADSPLPGVQSKSRWPRRWGTEAQLNRPARPDLVLKAIDRSVYNSRAWTFQERHLSRRVLCFLDEQVYFQCQKELWCEEPPINLTIMSTVRGWGETVKEMEWDAAFRFYAQVVQDYSWKQLTYPDDVMAAFSGIAATLEQHSGWTITHGLSEQVFDWALLWIPLGGTKRRPQPRSSLVSSFPSWSWMGWVGPVSYNLAYIDALVDLRTFVTDWKIEEEYTPIQDSTTTGRKARDSWSAFRKMLRRPKPPKPASHQPDTRTLHCQVLGKEKVIQQLAIANRNITNTGNGEWRWTTIREPAQPYNRSTEAPPGIALSFTAQVGKISHFRLTFLTGRYFDPMTHFDKKGAAMHGQNAVAISLGGNTCGMFYAIEAESILSCIPELRLIRLSATNIYREDTTSVINRDVPDSTYEIRGEDIKLWEAYNDWKLRFHINTNQRWRMLNVMLAWDSGLHYERLAIGQLEQAAWGSCSPTEERVRLI
ncbi:heterokaryon incompatibility protein-domain-containing protein [Apodospora peruviana]|uniref:Heterokaryon incompatibility protein-domain-containing protein n=1 Tax=Apodospora peruviana TaxID=516989 RepID=A0AAE0LYB7_9PEZI|nr:heterokaryon incompatibility protein-domain-containing protein [Apodospora peruviana]